MTEMKETEDIIGLGGTGREGNGQKMKREIRKENIIKKERKGKDKGIKE